MSKNVWDADGLVITTYAGAALPDGSPRKRIQITALPIGTTGERPFAILGPGQWLSLCRAVDELGLDCDGPERG